MFRKVIISAATASLIALVGFTSTGHLTAKAAIPGTNLGTCVVSGAATITPGLGPTLTPETFLINSGNLSDCAGSLALLSGGSFGGSGACPALILGLGGGGVITCLGPGNVSFSGSAGSHAISGTNCLLTQAVAVVPVACNQLVPGLGSASVDGNAATIAAVVAFTPTGVENPVQHVNFNGLVVANW